MRQVDEQISDEVNQLLSDLETGEGRHSSETAKELGRRLALTAIPKLRQTLVSTEDGRLRNACAIALSDMKDESCVALIAELLRDERTKGNRGSLIYALEGFDSKPLFSLLVEIAALDTFEARHMAFDALCAIEGDIDASGLGRAKEFAMEAIHDDPGDRLNSLLDLVELLDEFDHTD